MKRFVLRSSGQTQLKNCFAIIAGDGILLCALEEFHPYLSASDVWDSNSPIVYGTTTGFEADPAK